MEEVLTELEEKLKELRSIEERLNLMDFIRTTLMRESYEPTCWTDYAAGIADGTIDTVLNNIQSLIEFLSQSLMDEEEVSHSPMEGDARRDD